MWSDQWPGPRPEARGLGPCLGLKYEIVLRAGPGHNCCGPAGPGPHKSIWGRARAGSAQLLRARAEPGPQIIFAGRAWAYISGPCRALVYMMYYPK